MVEGSWFEHSVSELWVCLSTEGARNVSLSWLSPFREWDTLYMTSIAKFTHIKLYLTL